LDYQTKIIVHLDRALRDLKTLERRFIDNQKAITALQKDVQRLNMQVSKSRKIINANAVALSRYSKVTKVAATNNILFGNSVGFINKFLKIQLLLFRTAMLAATAYIGIKLYVEFNKLAESVDLAGRKLETFTKNADALNIVKKTAFKTGFAIKDLSKIVTRFAITTRGAFSTTTLVKWTEGLIMSARAAGTSTMELNNALIQLSQSFSAGFLMGDEYRSISENLPLFKMALRDVADEAGYASKSLKELSSGRKIDIELMSKALNKLSEESTKYIFALDNIEAAQERVKFGWEVWANSVAESRALKDSLNFLAGLLVHLANDGAGMNAMTEGFPEMAKDVEELSNELKDLKDTTGLVADEWARLVKEMTPDINKNTKGIFGSLFNSFLKEVYKRLNELPIQIGYILDVTKILFASFIDSIISLFKRLSPHIILETTKSFAIIDKHITRMRRGFNLTFGDEEEAVQLKKRLDIINQVLKDLNKETDSSKGSMLKTLMDDAEKQSALNGFYIQRASEQRNERLENFKWEQEFNRMFEQAIKEFAKNDAGFGQGKDKGLAKRTKEDQRAIDKAQKALKKYYQMQKELNRDIEIVKNPFSLIYDNINDLKDLGTQIDRLTLARKANTLSLDDYEKSIIKTKNEYKEFIKLSPKEVYDEAARGYDAVAAAAYDLLEIESQLNELKGKTTVSQYAYNRAIYEGQRALIQAMSAAKELSMGDQLFKGLSDGLWDFANNSKTVFEEISEITSRAFSGMTDELTEFVMTGKLEFGDLIDSILRDLVRLTIQQTITAPIAGALSGVLGTLGASIFGGTIGTPDGVGPPTPGMLQANGNAFFNGRVTPFADGDIFNSPRIFPMANGTGLMGEDGPEAIMPLKRGSDGKLGVASTEGRSKVTVNVINNSNTPSNINRKTGSDGEPIIEVLIGEVESSIANNIAKGNGQIPQVMEGTYGLNRATGSYR